MESGLSRAQIVVYAALGVALLLLGVKALRGESAPAADAGEGVVEISSGSVGGGGSGGRDLVVHVAGAVHEPGVYRMPAGARVADALQRAGGAKPAASADAINLAAPLSDGQQVVVPEASPTTGARTATASGEGPISLGAATAADLEGIDGIGPVTAEKIIAFRDERGGVGSIEELDEIPGIGPATIEGLRAGLQP